MINYFPKEHHKDRFQKIEMKHSDDAAKPMFKKSKSPYFHWTE